MLPYKGKFRSIIFFNTLEIAKQSNKLNLYSPTITISSLIKGSIDIG